MPTVGDRPLGYISPSDIMWRSKARQQQNVLLGLPGHYGLIGSGFNPQPDPYLNFRLDPAQVQGDLDWSLPDLTAGIMPGAPPMGGPDSVLNPPVAYGPMPGITQQTWSPYTMFDSGPYNPFDWQTLLGAGK